MAARGGSGRGGNTVGGKLKKGAPNGRLIPTNLCSSDLCEYRLHNTQIHSCTTVKEKSLPLADVPAHNVSHLPFPTNILVPPPPPTGAIHTITVPAPAYYLPLSHLHIFAKATRPVGPSLPFPPLSCLASRPTEQNAKSRRIIFTQHFFRSRSSSVWWWERSALPDAYIYSFVKQILL